MIRLNLARDRAGIVMAFGAGLPQYSAIQVLCIWLAATLPVAAVSWSLVPLLLPASRFSAVKLYWLLTPGTAVVQLALVAGLVRQATGSWSWSAARQRLRLNLPLSPGTAAHSLSRLWWILPWGAFVALAGAVTLILFGFGLLAMPLMGLVGALGGGRAPAAMVMRLISPRPEYAGPFDLLSPQFAGQWRWAALIIVVWAVTAFAEELLFRGVLLPATRQAFGRWRGPVNGALYALYHVHRPWAIPFKALEAVGLVRPARTFGSTVMSIGVRGGEGAVLTVLLLCAVLTPPFRPVASAPDLPYRSVQPAAVDLRRGSTTTLPAPDRAGTVDLRGRNLSELDLRDAGPLVSRAWFDDRTVWPAPDRMPVGFDAARIMDLGRNPGLGVRQLHTQGITGRGVSVGIVDRVLLTGHEEYKDRLDWYEEIDTGPSGEPAQMHGAAVASIAVGRTVGVAPGARLFYIGIGETGAIRNLADVARGIQRLLEINWRLPDDRRIRVISLSIGWEAFRPGFDAVQTAVRQAAASGVFVVSPNLERTHGFGFQGLGRPEFADPENVGSYEPGLFWADVLSRGYRPVNRLLVPMDSRTTASPSGIREYVFYRAGGWSWVTPYLAGVYALALQVNPVLTPERFLGLGLSTGRIIMVSRNGEEFPLGPIIDPPALITALGR